MEPPQRERRPVSASGNVSKGGVAFTSLSLSNILFEVKVSLKARTIFGAGGCGGGFLHQAHEVQHNPPLTSFEAYWYP